MTWYIRFPNGEYATEPMTGEPREFSTRRLAESWAYLSYGPFQTRQGALIERIGPKSGWMITKRKDL